MRRTLTLFSTVAAAAIALAQVPVAGPAPVKGTADTAYQAPRTAWGDPDLQGTWPGELRAPLQRPANLGTRTTLTEAEFAQREAQRKRQDQADAEEFPGNNFKAGIGPPSYWTERGKPSRQTSLIVDPPDGRFPAMTAEGKKQVMETPAEWRGVANTWEDLSLYYRCITRGLIGTMLPTAYDNGNQIVQAPGYVVIRQEMIHETRVIPLDGRAHAGERIRMIMGDSRGHWEGGTLVVETTNFTNKTSIGGNGVAYNGEGGRNTEALKVVERFTRTGAETLKYEAAIDDPKTWTRPWTIHIPFELNNNYGFFEYACHEGNYAMRDILMGMRADEAARKR